jgi:hypothetical protein
VYLGVNLVMHNSYLLGQAKNCHFYVICMSSAAHVYTNDAGIQRLEFLIASLACLLTSSA